MELNLNENTVVCCKTPEEKKAVLPVECSIILPDYYPDVVKILRYDAKVITFPVVTDEAGESASGNVSIEVIYVSEDGKMCSCGQLQPFSHSFRREGGKVSAAEIKAVCDELNCRAVNKRRIDLHGSIELTLDILEVEERVFIKSADGAGAVCKDESMEIITVTGEYYKSFTLDERGDLGYGRPKFGRAVRTSAKAEITECHVIQDKIVTKGEIRVKMLWTAETDEENENNEYYTSAFSFPVSRMIDAPGVTADDICDARYVADFPEIASLTEDDDGVSVKVKVGIFARVYTKSKTEFVTDMFSTEHECAAEKGNMTVIDGVFPVTVTESVFEKMELAEDFGKMTDVWAEITRQPVLTGEGKIAFSMKICVLTENADGEDEYFEKHIDREIFSPAEKKKTAFCSLCADVVSEDCNISRSGDAEISVNVLIDGTIYTSENKTALTGCTVNDDRLENGNNSAVVLYYAEKGENIWDISKKYRVPPKSIMLENGISENNVCERTMLVIPNL